MRAARINLGSLQNNIVALTQDRTILPVGSLALTLKDQSIVKYNSYILLALGEIFHSNNPDKITALETLLKSNWDLVKGTLLCYTAMPEHSITRLLCDVATSVTQEKNQPDLFPIQLLMPTVCTDHITNSGNNLTALDLETILKTHIVGREGRYLIPVTLLTTLSYSDDYSKIINFYYDLDAHAPEMAHLSEGELNRLRDHSNLTQSLSDIKKQYDVLADDHSNFLGQLNELIRLMIFNSSHGGIGTGLVKITQ